MNEDTLVARSLLGDLEAFNQLVLEHQNLAYQVAYYLLYDKDAATNAVQDSFVRAFRTLESFPSGSFRNWLMRIVTNTCCELLRKQPCHLIVDMEMLQLREHHAARQGSEPYLPLQTREWTEVLPHLIAGIHSLPDEQQVALVLNDIHGFSYSEMAEICGIAPGTAKTCVSVARARLRDYLVQEGCLPPYLSKSPGELSFVDQIS
jgi:RNA polymerase sigma-70 factor, ECF subfamily